MLVLRCRSATKAWRLLRVLFVRLCEVFVSRDSKLTHYRNLENAYLFIAFLGVAFLAELWLIGVCLWAAYRIWRDTSREFF